MGVALRKLLSDPRTLRYFNITMALLLAASLWITASQAIEFSAKERMGVQYAREVMPLMKLLQLPRRLPWAMASCHLKT